MIDKQRTIADYLDEFFRSNYNSPYNFAVKMGFQTASLAYMLRKNSFNINKLEELGQFDERIIDITVKYLLSKKKNPPQVESDNAYKEEIIALNQKVNKLQERIILLSGKIIDYQERMIDE